MKREEVIKLAIVAVVIWFFFVRNQGYAPTMPVRRRYEPTMPVKQGYEPTMPVKQGYEPTMPNKQKYQSQPMQNSNVSLLSGSDLIGVSDMVGGSRRNMSQDIRGEAAKVQINDNSSIGAGVPSISIGSSVVQDNMNSTLQLNNPWR